MPPTEGDHGAGDEETPDDLRTRDPQAPGVGAVEGEGEGQGGGGDGDDEPDVPEPNEPA